MSEPHRKPQTTRTLTSKTFTKAIAVRPFINLYGIDTSKKWASQRIINEATALTYIRENTTIPVPKVLDTGESENGTYLTVERMKGIQLDRVGNQCRQLPGHPSEQHQNVKCQACQAIANSIAADFIKQEVLPQLAALKHNVSGLNGIVIPPPWVTEYDRRSVWKQKTSKNPIFAFNHGDLGPPNLLFDPVTLTISAVVDWENAGFGPEEFLDYWAVEMDGYYDMYRNESKLSTLISLLE